MAAALKVSQAENNTSDPLSLKIFPIFPIVVVFPTPLTPDTKVIFNFSLFSKKYKVPILGLGLGEKEDDLQIFNAEQFADAFTQFN